MAAIMVAVAALAAIAFAVTRGDGGEQPGTPAPSSSVGLPPTPSLSLPSGLPSSLPTALPSELPSLPTELPTDLLPSGFPTDLPSGFPTDWSSGFPTALLPEGLVSAVAHDQLP